MMTLRSRIIDFIYQRVSEKYDLNAEKHLNKTKIEFIKGAITSLESKYPGTRTHNSKTKLKYTKVFFQIFFKFLLKFGVFFFIIILIAKNAIYYESYRFDGQNNCLNFSMLLFYFVFYVVLNFKLHFNNISREMNKNNRKVQIIKFSSEQIKYQMVKWKKIKVFEKFKFLTVYSIKRGDIILLKREQVCPADILIIDAKDNSFQVDSFFVDGNTNYTPKIPLKSTSFSNDAYLKKDLENYKKMLSGKIIIENINEKNPSKIQGYIKLKKDPKSEKFGVSNFVLKESVLKHTDWVIGFVLFADQQCFISKYYCKKKFLDDLENIINIINLGIFLQIVFLALIHSIFEQFVMTGGGPSFNVILKEQFDFRSFFSNYIIFYSPAILFYLNMTIDLALFIKKFVLERKFQHTVIINNPKTFASMHYIDKVFISKSSLLTGNIQLDSIWMQGEPMGLDVTQKKILKDYFKTHQFSANLKINTKSTNDSSSNLLIPDEPHSIQTTNRSETKFFPSIYNHKKNHHFMINLNLINDFDSEPPKILNKYDNEFVMKTLLLCHCTKTEYNPKNLFYIHDTFSKIHEEILNFCNEIDLKFLGNFKLSDSKMNCYKLMLAEKVFYFYIASMQETTSPRNSFSIIISENAESEINEEFTLLACGFDAENFIPCLSLSNNEKELLKDQLSNLKEKGTQSLIYATRTISKEEFNNVVQAKTNIGIDNNSQLELNNLYSSLEQNLEIVVIMNYKETLKENVFENMSALNDAQTKFFLLSSDAEYPTLATAYNAKIINKGVSVNKFISQNNKSAVLLMKHFLNNFLKKQETYSVMEGSSKMMIQSEHKKSFLKKLSQKKLSKGFTLILDGPTMELILKNAFLKENFKFMMIFTQNIICYHVSVDLKPQIIRFFKQTSINYYTKTLAIGSCYEDMKMFQEADISVEVVNNTEKAEIMGGASDFIMTNFEKLGHLILVKGPLSFRKIEKIVNTFIFSIELILVLMFFYEFFSSLSLSPLISEELFHITGITLTIMLVTYFNLSANPHNVEILETFPIIYKSNALKKRFNLLKILLKAIIPGIVVAVCFLGVTILYSNEIDNGNGRSFTDVQSQLFICVILITFLQNFSLISKLDHVLYFNIFAISLVFVGIIFAFTFFLKSNDLWDDRYIQTLTQNFWIPQSIAVFLFNGLFYLLLNFFLKKIYNLFNNRVSLYKETMKYFLRGNLILKIATVLENKYKNLIKPMIM